MTAAAMTKKLNDRNKTPNGVAPADAASPCCLTGWKTNPMAAGSIARFCSRVSAVIEAEGRILSEVVCPNRLAQSRRPAASEMNALGVAR